MDLNATEDPDWFDVPQALILAVVLNALGSFYAIAVALQVGPWRSLGVGLCAGLVLAVLLGLFGLSQAPVLLFSVVLPMLAAVAVELWHHRTYVRQGVLVVRSGILGRRDESFPITEVRDVQVSHPLLGGLWNVGDLEIFGYGWATTLPAVRRPKEYATKIMTLRNTSTARKSDFVDNSGTS